jgi:hypothetical protein
MDFAGPETDTGIFRLFLDLHYDVLPHNWCSFPDQLHNSGPFLISNPPATTEEWPRHIHIGYSMWGNRVHLGTEVQRAPEISFRLTLFDQTVTEYRVSDISNL